MITVCFIFLMPMALLEEREGNYMSMIIWKKTNDLTTKLMNVGCLHGIGLSRQGVVDDDIAEAVVVPDDLVHRVMTCVVRRPVEKGVSRGERLQIGHRFVALVMFSEADDLEMRLEDMADNG